MYETEDKPEAMSIGLGNVDGKRKQIHVCAVGSVSLLGVCLVGLHC